MAEGTPGLQGLRFVRSEHPQTRADIPRDADIVLRHGRGADPIQERAQHPRGSNVLPVPQLRDPGGDK